MGLEANHSIGEISMGIYACIYIYSIYNCIYIYSIYIYIVYIYSLLIARSCKARPWGKAWESTRPVLGTSPSSAGNLGHRPARWPYPSQASKNGDLMMGFEKHVRNSE